jgi:putative ABC transport system permease protein
VKLRHRLLFEALLRLFPSPFRERFSDGMREAFEERYHESLGGRGPGTAFMLRTTTDMVRSGLGERLRPTYRRSPDRSDEQQRMGWGNMMGIVIQDLRFAMRSLWRRPGFAAIAVITLALGIGANTAIFSVVNGVLLRPLPYVQPEDIVIIDILPNNPGDPPGSMSYPDILDLETESASLGTLVGISTPNLTLTGLGEPEVIEVAALTKGLMATFMVSPLLGRDIRADEFGPDGPAVAVLTHTFWQTRFGGDPNVLGRSLTLSGRSYEVVGVAPDGFLYPQTAELWIPRDLDVEACRRNCHTMMALGRLAGTATIESLRSEAQTLALNLEAAYPDDNTGKRFLVRSLQDKVVGEVKAGLWLVLGAVGIVLLIACANVANLLLVRASTLTGEVAVRSALGASRRRLMAQVMVESGLIAFFGGLGGLMLAAAGVYLLPEFSAGGIPRMEEVGIDGSVLLFTLGTVLVVTLLFGSVPAASLARSPLRNGLGSGSQGSGAGRGSGRSRSLLLGAEVALSAVLLVGAGLLLRTFTQLYAVDVGYETREIIRFSLNPQPESRDQIRVFYRTLEEQIRSIPGVEAAGSVFGPPLGRGHATGTVLVDGRPEPTPSEETEVAIHSMGPQWMETMRIPILRGRGLTAADDSDSEPVAVVNETFVRQNFPNEEVLGQSVKITVSFGFGSPTWRIVGVVPDIRDRGLAQDAEAMIYVPHGLMGPSAMSITVRGIPGGPSLLPAIRNEVREMAPNLPLYRIDSLEEEVRREVAPTRFYLLLVSLFAGLAAVLAAIGLYGVVAYAVSRRTREIGLRVALGAQREGIVRLVLGQGMRPALIGLGVGLTVAFFGGRVMEAVLFGVQPRDPVIFGLTGILLTLVALAATFVPAYRASQVDPVTALRAE